MDMHYCRCSGDLDCAYAELNNAGRVFEMKKLVMGIIFYSLIAVPLAFGAGITDKSIGGLIDVFEGGAVTEVLVGGGGAGNMPIWGADLPTAVTIGSGYIYRGGGVIIPVGDGGLGVSTLTDGGVLLGSGTGAVTPMAVLADGEFIVGDGTTDPVAESGNTARTSLGVGTGDSPTFSGINITGAHTVKKTNVADAAYGTSALTSDYIIAFTSLSAARAAVISTEDEDAGTATQPRIMIVKDESGNAGTYNITISLESGGTINGAASYVLNTNYESVTLYINGTNAFTY